MSILAKHEVRYLIIATRDKFPDDRHEICRGCLLDSGLPRRLHECPQSETGGAAAQGATD